MPELNEYRMVLAQQLRGAILYMRGYLAALDAQQCTPQMFRSAMVGAANDLQAFERALLQDFEVLGSPWRSPQTPPAPLPHGEHYPVTVVVLVDEPGLRLNDDEPFVDIGSWWPAKKVWTVTHQCRADKDVEDYPVCVAGWQPLFPIPPRGTLWK